MCFTVMDCFESNFIICYDDWRPYPVTPRVSVFLLLSSFDFCTIIHLGSFSLLDSAFLVLVLHKCVLCSEQRTPRLVPTLRGTEAVLLSFPELCSFVRK